MSWKSARTATMALGALTLMLCTASCGADDAAGDSPTKAAFGAAKDATAADLVPTEVKDKGALTIATNGDYPPYAFYGEDRKSLQGLAIDMGTAISTALGLKPDFQVTSFENFIPGVASGKYDVALSGTYDTPERAKTVDLVDYIEDGALVLVRKGNPTNVTPDSLCGNKVAVVAGTTFAASGIPEASKKCVADSKAPINMQVFPNASSAALALSSGRVDAYINPAASLYYLLTKNKEFEAAGARFNPIPAAAVLKKGSELSPAVAAAIEALKTQGAYQAILDKWGLSDVAIKCVTMNSKPDCVRG